MLKFTPEYWLSQAYTACKEESLFPPDNSNGTSGGRRYNCMCNMQQERGSHLFNYPINVHCESQPLQVLDMWQYILMSHTPERSRLHKHKSDAKHILPDCDAAINTNFLLGGSRFTFTFSSFSRPCSIQEQSPCCQSKLGYIRISEKSIQRSHN